MAKALILAATGAGATGREEWVSRHTEWSQRFEIEGMRAIKDEYARGPNRIQLLRKDLKSWQEYYEEFASHSATGAALTMQDFVLTRPTVFSLETKLQQLKVPTLIMVGDEDDICLEPSLFMKRKIPRSGLVVFPQSGHVINLEEPDNFNRAVLDFLTSVEAGSWA